MHSGYLDLGLTGLRCAASARSVNDVTVNMVTEAAVNLGTVAPRIDLARAVATPEMSDYSRPSLGAAMPPAGEAVMQSLRLLAVAVVVGAVAFVLTGPAARGPQTHRATHPVLASRQLRAGTLDPRHLPAVLPDGVFRAVTPGATPPQSAPTRNVTTTNGLLNSDMAIYVGDGATFTSLAAEGHLNLTSNDGGAHYVGTFVDDLDGATVFWASGTNISPTTLNGDYTVDTGNGTMHFSIGGTFTSRVPAKYGSNAKIGTILYGAHAWTARAPLNVSLGSFTIGAFHRPVTGTLTLTTDAIGYIVPFFGIGHVNSTWSYFAGGRLNVYHINSEGRYFPPDGSGDGSLTTVLGVGKTTFSIVDAQEDTSGQKIISGDAIAGSGHSTSLAAFSAH